MMIPRPTYSWGRHRIVSIGCLTAAIFETQSDEENADHLQQIFPGIVRLNKKTLHRVKRPPTSLRLPRAWTGQHLALMR